MVSDGSILAALGTLTLNPAASDTALDELRRRIPAVPDEYLSILAHSNGAEGSIGQTNYLVLWPAELIVEYNNGYGVDKFAPGLLLFGTDGGNAGYGFDCRAEPFMVVEVSLAGLDWSDAITVAPNLVVFLQHLADDAAR
jgi:hypothetical protein